MIYCVQTHFVESLSKALSGRNLQSLFQKESVVQAGKCFHVGNSFQSEVLVIPGETHLRITCMTIPQGSFPCPYPFPHPDLCSPDTPQPSCTLVSFSILLTVLSLSVYKAASPLRSASSLIRQCVQRVRRCARVVVQSLSCPTLPRPHGLQPTRLQCPQNSPGKTAGVGCHFLLQGIFPTQGLKLHLLYCKSNFFFCFLNH